MNGGAPFEVKRSQRMKMMCVAQLKIRKAIVLLLWHIMEALLGREGQEQEE